MHPFIFQYLKTYKLISASKQNIYSYKQIDLDINNYKSNNLAEWLCLLDKHIKHTLNWTEHCSYQYNCSHTHTCSKFNYHRKTLEVVRHTQQIDTQFCRFPPKRIPTLTQWWVAWSNDPESCDGGNITTGKSSYIRQVKGDDPDKKGYPHHTGWGLCMGLTIPPQKNMFCWKTIKSGNQNLRTILKEEEEEEEKEEEA